MVWSIILTLASVGILARVVSAIFSRTPDQQPFASWPMPPQQSIIGGHFELLQGEHMLANLKTVLNQVAGLHGKASLVLFGKRIFIPQYHVHVKDVFKQATAKHRPWILAYHFSKLFSPKANIIAFHEGDEWRFRRSVMSEALKYANLNPIADNIFKSGLQVCEYIDSQVDNSISVLPIFQCLILDLMGHFGFGHDFKGIRFLADHGSEVPFLKAFRFLMNEYNRRAYNPLWWNIMSIAYYYWLPTAANRAVQENRQVLIDEFDALIDKYQNVEAEDRLRQSAESSDEPTSSTPEKPCENFLQNFMRATNDITGKGFDREDLIENSIFLLFAGIETTAVALSIVLYMLAVHPEEQSKLQVELDRAFPTDRPVTPDDLKGLSYTKWCIKEALRLYPPFPGIFRTIENDVTVDGETIPAGSCFYMLFSMIHRYEGNYKEPDRFWPERWDQTLYGPIPQHAWAPFAAGPRTCIGFKMAMLELSMMLALLASRFEFELDPTYVFTCPRVGLTLRPSEGIKMIFRRRQRKCDQ